MQYLSEAEVICSFFFSNLEGSVVLVRKHVLFGAKLKHEQYNTLPKYQEGV